MGIITALCCVSSAWADWETSAHTVPAVGTARPSGYIKSDLRLLKSLFEGSPARLAAEKHRAMRAERFRGARLFSAFDASQYGVFDRRIAEASAEFGVDPFLLKGLLENESHLQASRVGVRVYVHVEGRRKMVSGGARGIGQFTADGVNAVNSARLVRHVGGEFVQPFSAADAMDPYLAIDAAAELLASYIRRFGRDGGITAYNSGPYGGLLVKTMGFYAARRNLKQRGHIRLQGHRFLINVLRKTNRLRRGAGLAPLSQPRRFRRARRENTSRRAQAG